MPILLNVLGSSDQKVVEQGCLCVSRVVESFKYRQDRLEVLVSADLLRAILRLLLPGTTNLIGPHIHTQFLRVLAITAKASPTLSAELFKMNVVDTLYQILTGVSPPDGTDDVASKIDSVVIMQALIHRPRDQVFETLNVICELLPDLPRDPLLADLFDLGHTIEMSPTSPLPPTQAPYDKRLELLKTCKEELKRFAIILLPTLTDAYSSTVNLSVRQKVLNAQLKMLSNLDTNILEEALRSVPYSSYLASILSQQDHPTLVLYALHAAELLLQRLGHIYRYQFHREGVMAEITNLANQEPEFEAVKTKASGLKEPSNNEAQKLDAPHEHMDEDGGASDGMHDDNEDGDSSDIDPDEDEMHDDMSGSPVSSQDSSSSRRNHPASPGGLHMDRSISRRARKVLEAYENEANGKHVRDKAVKILEDLRQLAADIEECFIGSGQGNGIELFQRLSNYFDGDALESITSSELLNSGIVRVLLDVFNSTDGTSKIIPI